MDKWSKEKRSEVMAKIRGRDTKPELIVRRWLFRRGYRFRKNYRGLPGTPDVVLRKYRTVIFVHGCFWHGHGDVKMPDSNKDFWAKKIERNKQRDEQVRLRLRRLGWNVMTIWECQLTKADRENTLFEMEALLNSAFLRQYSTSTEVDTYKIPESHYKMAAEDGESYGYCDDDY